MSRSSPQNWYLDSNITAFFKGELPGNRSIGFVPNVSLSRWHTPRVILKRDTWTPVLRFSLKGNCPESLVRVSFRMSLSLTKLQSFPIYLVSDIGDGWSNASRRPGDNRAVFKTIFSHLDWPLHRTSAEQSLNWAVNLNTVLKRVKRPHRSSRLLLLTNHSG